MNGGDVSKDLRVLVVDDNRVIRELVTRQLLKLGVQSETAVDGKDALEKWAAGSYDAILMDVQMPEMSGIEATQKIREQEASRGTHTLIIALTGHGSRVECISAGMDDFIAKPMNIATLKSTLQKWISNYAFADV